MVFTSSKINLFYNLYKKNCFKKIEIYEYKEI